MGVEKYSYETKIEVMKYTIETKSSIAEASKVFGIPKTLIERWLSLYRMHGEKGLASRNIKKDFAGQFKIEVLKYMQDYELSYTKTAAHFCLDVATVSKWHRIYVEKGEMYLLSPSEKRGNDTKKVNKLKKTKTDLEIQGLISENQRLKMENEYLKKLNALVREKVKSATKKK